MLKKYFIAGLLVWLPILATVFVLKFILGILDSAVEVLPNCVQLPGLGLVTSILIIMLTGLLVRNFLGEQLLAASERLLQKIPMVRTIYSGTKQILETVLASKGQSFRKVLLIEYPRKGVWSIGFQTGLAHPEINKHTGKMMLSVFIPTTPNPTSGFLVLVPADEVTELSISIEEALKFVISLGTIISNTMPANKTKIS